MFAKSALALAAVAGFVAAAPIEQRGPPAGWAYGYLEDYDTYHVRYLALKCHTKKNTDYFQDCCRPMLSTENLWDNRKEYCRPSKEATEYVVSSLSAKAAGHAATPAAPAAAPSASASEDCDDDDEAAPASHAAPAPSAAATTAAAESKAAPAAAPSSSSTTSSPAAEKYVAPAPSSSSTTTTQAWTPAPTTQAPAPTTQAPAPQSNNNQQHSGGYATFFYQGGNAGACGKVHGDYDMIAAIDHEQWGDQSFSTGSNTCGRWLTVCNSNNGKCVSVMIADVCPTCANGNSLDLSVGAFRAIASESEGMVPISWSWN